MISIEVHHGDSRAVLRQMIDDGVRVHSVVCDPPYGLTSIVKRFGTDGATAAQHGTDGAFARASAGFMGSKWDGTGIERDPAFWRLVHDVLLPGGYVAAFSSPRTGHWMACAMEMAGFVMHPFLGWCYGQGFPKAHNAERAVSRELCTLPGRHYEGGLPKDRREGDHVCPPHPDAAPWEGYAYGGQALKPGLEPIYIAQRPFDQKNGALNLIRHGAGAINIDGCRIHGEDAQGGAYTIKRLASGAKINASGEWKQDREYEGFAKPGRWPANLLHDGSAEVVVLFPQSAGQLADANTDPGRVKTGRVYGEMRGGREGEPSAERRYADQGATDFAMKPGVRRNDTGSAARFFNSFAPDTDPIFYCPKATKADRAGSKHPTVKPIALMAWLCRLLTPPGGTVLDPFAGSGTTGQAAANEGLDVVLIEAEDQFVTDIRRRFDMPISEFDDLIGCAPMSRKMVNSPEKMRQNSAHTTCGLQVEIPVYADSFDYEVSNLVG